MESSIAIAMQTRLEIDGIGGNGDVVNGDVVNGDVGRVKHIQTHIQHR